MWELFGWKSINNDVCWRIVDASIDDGLHGSEIRMREFALQLAGTGRRMLLTDNIQLYCLGLPMPTSQGNRYACITQACMVTRAGKVVQHECTVYLLAAQTFASPKAFFAPSNDCSRIPTICIIHCIITGGMHEIISRRKITSYLTRHTWEWNAAHIARVFYSTVSHLSALLLSSSTIWFGAASIRLRE